MSIAIVRMNPMHLGHKYLIGEMGKVSNHVYIGLGSCQEYGTLKNPYTPKERAQMIRNVFPNTNKYHIFFLNDHPNMTPKEWQTYCLTELRNQCGLEYQPTRYFGGCEADLEWWEEAKNLDGDNLQTISLCRDKNDYISATEIRKYLRPYLQGDEMSIDWIDHIPKENIEYVKEKYPKKLIEVVEDV